MLRGQVCTRNSRPARLSNLYRAWAKTMMTKSRSFSLYPYHRPQNKQGQTAGHYAVSYQFFDLSEWLFLQDGNGGGTDDTIVNKFGLGPYDGLQADTGTSEQPLMLEAAA